MTTSAVKNNFLPPGLVSNLQDVLRNRKGSDGNEEQQSDSSSAEPNNNDNESAEPSSSTSNSDAVAELDNSKPLLLVTNGDGIESPGLTYLVEALVRQGRYNVHVLAPQSLVSSFFRIFFKLLLFCPLKFMFLKLFFLIINSSHGFCNFPADSFIL